MAKEYFDVLDENGNKTGEIKLRTEVHRDGDWHKAVHIWVLNNKREILLQRRCTNKDSFPNMLDTSCAGHLSAGDDALQGALRELEEELDFKIEKEELKYIDSLKLEQTYGSDFINNEFNDIFYVLTDKDINDFHFQEEEISEIMFVPYEKFREMVKNKQEDLVIHEEELRVLFDFLDNKLKF